MSKELHNKLIDKKNLQPKDKECGSLCSKKNLPRPSLDYKYIAPSKDEVDKAFDLLFEETIKIK